MAGVKRRLQTVGVAALGAFLGLLLAAGFARRDADDYLCLGVAWLAMAVGLTLEPLSPTPMRRASVLKTSLAAGGGALGGALLTFGAMRLATPSWFRAPEGLGSLLVHGWSVLDGVRIVLVLALAALPAPLLLLLVRRVERQLEWPAAAAALGPVLVGLTLYTADVTSWLALLLLVLSGLPLAFAAYLLDRRHLGPEAIASFPEPPAEPVVADDGATTRPSPAPRSWRGPARLLGAALALGLLWAFAVARVGPALAPSGIQPGAPDLAALFDEISAQQEQHRARTGAYARTLGALEALPLEVRGGLTRGYLLRYARTTDARWVLTADPVPARPGWPSLRLVGPGGVVERGSGPFPLKVEGP